jgi:ATP-binding protein involved in chromosome partitioning
MFRRVDVPVLGIVENMSYFVCPHCGERTDIFGHGGAAHEAANIGVPFLGAVPLHAQIRALSDAGTPVVATEPDSGHASAFRAIAAHTWQQIQAERTTSRQPPRIIME